DRHAVEVLCGDGPERLRDLIALGVGFDRDGDRLARGLEAAHSVARVVRAGGDATGLAIEAGLVARLATGNVDVHEHARLVDLVVDGGRVVGAEIDTAGETRTIAADAVVLSTGGFGRLFRHTTNPAIATGDGLAA